MTGRSFRCTLECSFFQDESALRTPLRRRTKIVSALRAAPDLLRSSCPPTPDQPQDRWERCRNHNQVVGECRFEVSKCSSRTKVPRKSELSSQRFAVEQVVLVRRKVALREHPAFPSIRLRWRRSVPYPRADNYTPQFADICVARIISSAGIVPPLHLDSLHYEVAPHPPYAPKHADDQRHPNENKPSPAKHAGMISEFSHSRQ
jgi:hypothetical protein